MMWLCRRCVGVYNWRRMRWKQRATPYQTIFTSWKDLKQKHFSSMGTKITWPLQLHWHQSLGTALWRPQMREPLLSSASGPISVLRALSFSASIAADPIEIHKQRLNLWFSHLPQEEKQFGGYFTPETMHIDPLILERKPAESRGIERSQIPHHPSLSVEQLFDRPLGHPSERGMNIMLYGAVGTGKSTVVRKLVLDWCAGTTLSQFKLLVPFSCEDLSQSKNPTSLRDLVGRKYLHLRRTPFLSGEAQQARDVLFIFNGMERMRLNFRIASTELCSDPNEALPTGTLMVNLLRKYLLPEATILVTTRLSAVEHIPKKYVSRYMQICGFNDPESQRSYFTSRLLQQATEKLNPQAESLIELLYLNLQKESQLAFACYLPSYCWLTCATLHFLHFTDTQAPIRTLTGIFTSFLRLNFGGEVLEVNEGSSGATEQSSLMRYVVQTVGKLAFDGVTKRRTRFTEEELEQWVGGKTKTDEELQQLSVFRNDVLDFFLVPCVENTKLLEAGDVTKQRYVFAIPTMQEYLAALYMVLGENKSALERLSRDMSMALGQAGEDLQSLGNILSKFIPLRIFAVFNLLRLAPNLYERVLNMTKGRIARTMAAEMFRSEDSFNEDVLDQVEQSLLGVQGPQPKQELDMKSFELYPIFMGGLLHYGNRALLEQLGCHITSTAVAQITHGLTRQLAQHGQKNLPPTELMDLLLFLYEFQNPRLTSQVLSSLKTINLSTVRMTPIKCFILSWVLTCSPRRLLLDELNLSSCHLRLCNNPLLESGAQHLLEGLQGNQSLKRLDLMHTGLDDSAARQLAEHLSDMTSPVGLEELNVAYNDIGDSAGLKLVAACRKHPTVHTVHLYLNQLSEMGKQSLYVDGSEAGAARRLQILTSVTEGADLSDAWPRILSIIRQNATSWDRGRVREQLLDFLRDLESSRRQQRNFLKKHHFRRVEKGVRECLRTLDDRTP
ncbi:NLR family member X1 isoform X2 [Brienomyrus brachyistius]|uniref:NLR family member X1 isoform X2 n=1 Tax=Brienomyrus brachyistius TaxID=42636 RepID=UPI0020B2E13F|nr:NLR family member X1 isoform X2 [Brienomyrus brachyistius]